MNNGGEKSVLFCLYNKSWEEEEKRVTRRKRDCQSPTRKRRDCVCLRPAVENFSTLFFFENERHCVLFLFK